MQINTVIESFKQLVTDFTNHHDFSIEGNLLFKQKQKMLIDFAKNINSLVVCLKVLEQETDQSLLYFASQFVKDKLKYEFEQLSQQSLQGTHSQIAQIMSKRKDLNKIVSKNLAFSLTYIYIHCYTSTYTIFNFIKTTFYGEDNNPTPTPTYYKYLFKFLDCIPCEIDNRKLVIDEIKRNEVEQNLKSQQVQILNAMHTLFQETYPYKDNFVADDFENMLYAFAQWIKISNPPTEVTSVLHNHSLLTLAFNSLSDPTLSESATQALQAAIMSVRNIEESPEFYSFIGHNLFLLINNVKKQIEDQETDEAENFLKVICNYGSHACQSLVQNLDTNGKQFLEQMIQFTKQESLNIFGQLSDFWENFLHFLINRSTKSTLTKQIADSIVGSLYQTYCYRIRYNSNQLKQLNELSQKQLTKLHQSVQDIRQKREIARYIFESIAKYLQPKVYLMEVMKTVTEFYHKKQDECWHLLEASLYSLRDVMKLFPNCEDVQLFLLLSRQLLQQTSYVIVRKSIVRALEPLFAMQEKNQQFILFVLNLIVGLLDEKLLSDKVNSAFERGCKENADILCRHIKQFSVLLEKYPHNQSILLGIIQILKKNPDLLTQTLPKIIQGPLQSLQQARNSKQKRQIFTKLFTIIEAVPKGETQGISNIIEHLLKNMFPIIKQILQAPQKTNQTDQDKLIQRTVKFLKLVMRGIPNEFTHYLKQIFDIVLAAYPLYPINSYIYLFQITFTVYYKSKNPQIIAYLQMLYIQFCNISYVHLNHPSSVNNLQNLADDFIGLNKRIITFHTRMFFQSGQVEKILEFAVHCMGSGVLRPASSASQLLEIVFMIYWTPYSRQAYESEDKGEVVQIDAANNELYQTLKQFILPIIPTLLIKMFSVLETVPPQTIRDNVLDCFEAIALAFPKESQIIWQQPLLQLPQDILTNSEKQRLKINLYKLGSDNHTQFLNSEHIVSRLIYTMSCRYGYRKSRQNLNVTK